MNSRIPNALKLSRYYDEFEGRKETHMLSSSDSESWSMSELLALADDECKNMWQELQLSYGNMQGNPILRHEVAKLHGVTSEQTIIVASQEAIYIGMNSLVDYLKRSTNSEKLHVITTFPAFQSLYESLRVLGCEMSFWTAKWADPGWRFDLEELESLIQENTKILVVNFPHNPTGYVPSKEEWESIVNICRKRNLYLFSDEVYRFSNNDGSEPLPSASELYEKAIAVSSLSKSWGLPGIRIGWLCTKNTDIIAKARSFRDYLSICSAAPSEILAIIALRNKPAVQERTLRIIHENLPILEKFFNEHNDIFEWEKPRACTTAFVKVKGWLLELGSGGAKGFCDTLLDECHVVLAPACLYNFDYDYVRFGFGKLSVPKAMELLEKFIDRHKPKKA